MHKRVGLIMLASVMLVLFLGITAIAQPAPPAAPAAGSAAAALAVGNEQLGKPFAYGAEGPDAFSCVGLMRYVLRTAGVDENAPWVPEDSL